MTCNTATGWSIENRCHADLHSMHRDIVDQLGAFHELGGCGDHGDDGGGSGHGGQGGQVGPPLHEHALLCAQGSRCVQGKRCMQLHLEGLLGIRLLFQRLAAKTWLQHPGKRTRKAVASSYALQLGISRVANMLLLCLRLPTVCSVGGGITVSSPGRAGRRARVRHQYSTPEYLAMTASVTTSYHPAADVTPAHSVSSASLPYPLMTICLNFQAATLLVRRGLLRSSSR